MTGFNSAILLLVGLAFTSAQNCGNVIEGTIMPNANNCNSYYVCNAGMLTSYTCPANYGYSSATQTCSPTVSCSNQINDQPYYPNNSPYYGYPNNVNSNYPYNNGYPNYGNNQPYWNGVSWVYPNNVNNVNDGNVNWIYPTNVNSNSYPNYGYPSYPYPSNGYPYPPSQYPYPYAASASSSTADSTSPCFEVADGSYVPSPTSCSQFYFCSQGQAIASQCPSGYGFSTTQHACVTSTSCTA